MVTVSSKLGTGPEYKWRRDGGLAREGELSAALGLWAAGPIVPLLGPGPDTGLLLHPEQTVPNYWALPQAWPLTSLGL